ncbi:MAG: SDR family NAD(P)-dependent oxidoreductase [Porticoccus sp.]
MSDLIERPTALVTGGATRLGFSFAYALAEAGYNIALHYHRSADNAQQAAKSIKALGVTCKTFPFDLSGECPEGLIESVLHEFSSLDVLINNASVYEAATIAHTDMALLQQQFSVNFFAPLLLTSAFADQCVKGNVINILDNKIAFQQNHYAAYLLSKKALSEFTQLAAIEFASRLRINGIAPGVVMPGDERTDDYVRWRIDGIPLKRQGRVDDLISAMNYLLNNEFVTGQVLIVDGGEGLNYQGRHAEQFSDGDVL